MICNILTSGLYQLIQTVSRLSNLKVGAVHAQLDNVNYIMSEMGDLIMVFLDAARRFY